MFLLQIIILVYVCFFLLMIIGFILSLIEKKSKNEEFKPCLISIVISVRNEFNRLDPLLKSLESQKIKNDKIEIIFIDDHSSDYTIDKLKSWSLESSVSLKIISLDTTENGKKSAINKGVYYANGGYILTLDADVSFDSNFIDSLFSYLTKRKDFYFIPIFETSDGNVFSRIESNMLSLVTVGSAKLNYPLLSNGAAMLFRKDCFLELQPYLNNAHILSGDDIFLLEYFKNNNKLFDVISPYDAYLNTESPQFYKQYLDRSLRWSGKMKFSNLHVTKCLGLLVLLTNYIVLGLFISFIFMPSFSIFLLIISKFLIDFIGLFLTVLKYRNSVLLLYSPIMLLFYPFHLLILFVLSFFNLKTSWKGRLLVEKK